MQILVVQTNKIMKWLRHVFKRVLNSFIHMYLKFTIELIVIKWMFN